MHCFASDTRQSLLCFFISSFSFPLPCFYWINFTHLRWWCWNWMSKAALLRLPLAENPICIDVCVCSSGTLPDKASVWDIVCVLLVQMIAAYRCADSVSPHPGIKFSTKHAMRAVDETAALLTSIGQATYLSWVSFKRSTTGRYKQVYCVSVVLWWSRMTV